MSSFEYHRPTSVADAVAALGGGDEATVVAGGMTLLPTIKQRLADPSDLVDLSGVGEMKGISEEGGAIVIGAMTTHGEVASNPVVQAKIPALASLAGNIGDPQVRNRGTIGGSVANNDPAACYPAGLMAMNATVHTNKRAIPVDDFFTGMFETALEEGELVTKVSVPVPDKAAYIKFPQPASRYALVGVAVAQTGGAARVAVTGAGQDGVFRVADAEAALSGSFSPDALDGVSVDADGLNSDLHGSAAYRASLVMTLAKRAVAAANG
ncbi:MAG: xanthine dehydrogenase family protein subunit M [Alphaproteobacteria bacterium]|nr:xanthine dehydrogenase family protein subunit M [Alphaproteobacteria bacterium]